MKKIKSIAALSLAVMMICGMASCGNTESNEGGNDNERIITKGEGQFNHNVQR